MAEVEHLAEEEAEAHLGGWKDMEIGWIRRLVFIGCGMAAAQQLTGINSIMYYGTELLKEAGFSASAAIIANIANGVLAVVGSAICLFFVVDRVRRRDLILRGFIATTACHGLILAAALMMPEGTARAVVILVLCVTFVFFISWP